MGLFVCFNKSIAQDLNLDSVVKNFKGYKVPNNVKSLGSTYWKRNTPVMIDLVIQTFQKPLSFAKIANEKDCIQGGLGGAICGDFNNDGYIDVFTPGGIDSSSFKDNNRGIGLSFLIWDSVSKVFKDTSLLNDKNRKVIISGYKAVPVYLNTDNYVDIVIFPADDSQAPVMLIVSDGKGAYDYSEIITNEKDFPPGKAPTIFKSSGDVDDLNGDGLPDLFLPANNFSYIFWGIPTYPYFNSVNHPKFVQDVTNFPGFNDNGFGEICTSCAGMFGGTIADVNKDGGKDLILFGASALADRIVLNKGSGRFNETGVVNIPRYIAQGDGGDYMTMDLNDDGLNDFVTITGGGLDGKKSYNNIYTVLQKPNGTFVYDTTLIEYSNKFNTKFLGGAGGTGAFLFSYDFNNDGKNDIGYINSSWGDECGIYNSSTNSGNIMPYKTVFIKEGNKYIEKDYYQYDPYAKYLLTLLRKRYICSPELMKKPTFTNKDFLFCKRDSLKVSVNNVASGSSLIWNFGNKTSTSSDNFKYFSDTSTLTVTMVNTEFGCSVNSDKITLAFKSSPPTPIVKDTAYCFNTKTMPLNATTLQMHDVYWSDQAGMLGAKMFPTPNSTIVGQQKFYVTQIDLSSNCASAQALLTVDIEKAANAPIVKDTTFCQSNDSSSLNIKADNGNYLLWYSNNLQGSVGSKVPISINKNDTNSKVYYVSQASNKANCESPLSKITIKINPAPLSPIVRDTFYCNNTNADTLKAIPLSGHSLKWYGNNASSGTGNSLGNIPNTLTIGNFSYYVSQINNSTGCEGPRAKIGVTINPLPSAPNVRDTTFCNNISADTLRVNPSTGNTLLWYGTNVTGGTSSKTAIKPSTENIGTVSYYVSQVNTITSCESLRAKINITIKPIPPAPILLRDSANNLVANTNVITWFKDGLVISDTTQKFKPTIAGSYTAKTTQNGCISAMSNPYYYLVTEIVNLNASEFIKLAPNPFNNQLNFDFVVKGYQRLNMDVFDITNGAKVLSKQNLTPGIPVFLDQISAGTYVIKITSNDLKISYQFKMVKL